MSRKVGLSRRRTVLLAVLYGIAALTQAVAIADGNRGAAPLFSFAVFLLLFGVLVWRLYTRPHHSE